MNLAEKKANIWFFMRALQCFVLEFHNRIDKRAPVLPACHKIGVFH